MLKQIEKYNQNQVWLFELEYDVCLSNAFVLGNYLFPWDRADLAVGINIYWVWMISQIMRLDSGIQQKKVKRNVRNHQRNKQPGLPRITP